MQVLDRQLIHWWGVEHSPVFGSAKPELPHFRAGKAQFGPRYGNSNQRHFSCFN
jgi:hypothetical protein